VVLENQIEGRPVGEDRGAGLTEVEVVEGAWKAGVEVLSGQPAGRVVVGDGEPVDHGVPHPSHRLGPRGWGRRGSAATRAVVQGDGAAGEAISGGLHHAPGRKGKAPHLGRRNELVGQEVLVRLNVGSRQEGQDQGAQGAAHDPRPCGQGASPPEEKRKGQPHPRDEPLKYKQPQRRCVGKGDGIGEGEPDLDHHVQAPSHGEGRDQDPHEGTGDGRK